MNNKGLIAVIMLFVVAGSTIATEETNSGNIGTQALRQYSVSPAVFIRNVGQISEPTVRYAFYGSGVSIFHTTNGPVFQLFKKVDTTKPAEFYSPPKHSIGDEEDFITQSYAFSATFVGAKQLEPTGHDKQAANINYFIGNKSNWHINVDTYSKVVYPQLYDGIDLHTFGKKSRLKYEFHVAPGADYSQIGIAYNGIDGLSIDSDGVLHIETPFGELLDDAVYIYQIIDGRQVEIPGRYRLIDEKTYTFEITGRIDPAVELVIDPDLTWSKFLGGSSDDYARDIAVDNFGCAFITGATNSMDFPATSGAYRAFKIDHSTDAFVTKLDDSGGLEWCTYLGGFGNDIGYGVAVDPSGDVFVTGETYSGNFPTEGNVHSTSLSGPSDAFVTRISSTGELTGSGGLTWSTYLGGSGDDTGYAIIIDNSGNPVVTGATTSGDFPKRNNGNKGGRDAFVSKLMATASTSSIHLIGSTYLGGSGEDECRDIAAHTGSDVLVTGSTKSADLDGSSGGYSGNWDAFAAMVNTAPPNVVWSRYLGGSEDDRGYGIDIDTSSHALLTGSTFSADFPNAAGSYCCGSDAYAAKFDVSSPGSPLLNLDWSCILAGSADDVGRDIIAMPDNHVLITGWTTSYDFPTPGGFDTEHGGGEDAFLAKMKDTVTTATLIWASYLGGSEDDRSYGIVAVSITDPNILITGETYSADFPVGGEDEFGLEYNGDKDAFVAKINTGGVIGKGNLTGNVFYTNGDPVDSADVSIPGQTSTSTNSNGEFSYNTVPAGPTIVTVTKTGYYPATRRAIIHPDSTTHVNIVMVSEVEDVSPVVIELYAGFCEPGKFAYYMDGPSFYEKFTTTIQWPDEIYGFDPNRIEWRIIRYDNEPNQIHIINCSNLGVGTGSSKHTRCFDMGSDFGVGGRLEVVAVAKQKTSGDEKSSVAKSADDIFEITAPPPCIDPCDPDAAVAVPMGNAFEYHLPGLMREFQLAGMPNIGGIPIFSNSLMNLGMGFKDDPEPLESTLVGIVKHDGTTDIFPMGWDGKSRKKVQTSVTCSGSKEIELPKIRGAEISATPYAGISFDVAWEADSGWEAGGSLFGGCDFAISTPEFPVPPAPHPPVYAKAAFELGLGLTTSLDDWVDYETGPQWANDITFEFEPMVKAIFGANVKVATVEGYLGGGFHADVLLSPDSIDLGDHYVLMGGGVEVEICKFISHEWTYFYEWWPPSGMSGDTNKMGVMKMNQVLSSSNSVLPDDYLDHKSDPLILGENENLLDPNVFPNGVPEVVQTGDGLLAVWIDDNTNRNYLNQSQVMYSTYVDGQWTDPCTVDDGNTADMNPQLISLGNGKAACIWQDAASEVQEGDSLDTFLSKTDIAASIYTGGSWLPAETLTADGDTAFDRSPEIAAVNNTDMLAVWIKNPSNDPNLYGDEEHPNKIMWSKYNGTWSDPCEVSTDEGMILGTTLVYEDGIGTYIFCRDDDDDPNTVGDQDLWITTYSENAWSEPCRVSNDDGISDVSPRLLYDNDDNLWLFWLKGEELCYAIVDELSRVDLNGVGYTNYEDFGLFAEQWQQEDCNSTNQWCLGADLDKSEEVDIVDLRKLAEDWLMGPGFYPASVRTLGKSLGSEDFSLAMGSVNNVADGGQIALIWNDASIYGNDIWICYGEPIDSVWYWSMPLQITFDDASERFISGAFESNGNLVCVYNKRQTIWNDVTRTDPNDNEQRVVPGGVPSGGRTDLCYTSLQTIPDLSIAVQDVDVVPPNPMPGTWAKVSAEVKNIGISPAQNIEVAFSDDTAVIANWSPGPVQTISDIVVGGASAEVSAWWRVPPSVIPRTITVGIQSFEGDYGEPNSNNIASFTVLRPDLTISEMTAHFIGIDTCVVTVRVANEGVLPMGTSSVILRKSDPNGMYDPDGQSLNQGQEYVQAIAPAAYQDIPFIFSTGEISGASRIYSIVDEPPSGDPNDEFNEDNNMRSVRLRP